MRNKRKQEIDMIADALTIWVNTTDEQMIEHFIKRTSFSEKELRSLVVKERENFLCGKYLMNTKIDDRKVIEEHLTEGK